MTSRLGRFRFPVGRGPFAAAAVVTALAAGTFGLVQASLPSRTRLAKGGVAFSVVGPARYESVQPVVVELVVENRSNKAMRLLKPSLGASSVHGTVATPRGRRQLPDPLVVRFINA